MVRRGFIEMHHDKLCTLDLGYFFPIGERTKKGHPVFYPSNPARRPIVGSGTPSDQRSLNNVLSELKAAGLIWPWTARDRRKAKKQ